MSKAIKVSDEMYSKLKSLSLETNIPMSRILRGMYVEWLERDNSLKSDSNRGKEEEKHDKVTNDFSDDENVDVSIAGMLLVILVGVFFYFLYERGLI